MAKAQASIELNISAGTVWQLIGGFGSLPDWLPYIPKSVLSEGGRVRKLQNPDGFDIIERLVEFSEPQRSYSYAILEAPFPVKDYISTLRVLEVEPEKSRVEWSGEFTPVGVDEDFVTALFDNIYQSGLKALAAGIEVAETK